MKVSASETSFSVMLDDGRPQHLDSYDQLWVEYDDDGLRCEKRHESGQSVLVDALWLSCDGKLLFEHEGFDGVELLSVAEDLPRESIATIWEWCLAMVDGDLTADVHWYAIYGALTQILPRVGIRIEE